MACPFLDENERCGIHAFRSGICRLFPLGRLYEEEGFRYFLLTKECKKENRGKVKVKKWLGITNLKAYEQYISDWHQFLLTCEESIGELEKRISRSLRRIFCDCFIRLHTKQRMTGHFIRSLSEKRTSAKDAWNLEREEV